MFKSSGMIKAVATNFIFLHHSLQRVVFLLLQKIFPCPALLNQVQVCLFFLIYSVSSHPSIIITQAARMCSDADVCPPDESLHYRLVWVHRSGFKGTCLNNLTLLQTSGWWRGLWSLRNHFTLHGSQIIIFCCCIGYQKFTMYLLQQQNTLTTKLFFFFKTATDFSLIILYISCLLP